MKSIYTRYIGLHRDGAPVDFLATLKSTLSKAADREVALYEKTYADKYFDYETPQMSLTAEGLVGKKRIRIMATLIGDESPTPDRRSDGFDTWRSEIPRVGHKFQMKASQFRKLQEVYENPRLKEAQKVKAIEKTLTADTKDAYLGCKDVMDFIFLKAMSNWGVAQFVPEINNPGGRQFEVDYLMDEANKLVSAYNWTDANVSAGNISPINQLATICSALRQRGIEPGEILMDQKLYFWLKSNANTRLLAHGTDKKDMTVTKSELEELLADNEIPAITVVTKKCAISKDGKRSEVEPWNGNHICIKPAGKVGYIQPAIEDNEILEEDNVTYMDAGNGIRIAKWRTGESTNQVSAEWTQGSARMIPIFEDIESIVDIQVRGIVEVTVPADADGAARSYCTLKEFQTLSENVG